jgi:hypothetical protein
VSAHIASGDVKHWSVIVDELEMQWQELVDTGECEESFDDWYSGRCADAYDRAKASCRD